MTVAELLEAFSNAGSALLLGVLVLPCVVGLVAFVLRRGGRLAASQVVANVGIAVGFFAVFVQGCWIAYAWSQTPSPLRDTQVLVMVAPTYLLVAGLAVEHWIHPGRQEWIRARIRKAALFVITLGVLYFVLSRLRMHMLIWTGMFGFVFFMLALVGILYFLVRKVV